MGHVGNSNWQISYVFLRLLPTKKTEGFWLGGRDSGSGCSNGSTSSHSHCSESQQDFEAKELQGSSGYLVFAKFTAMKHRHRTFSFKNTGSGSFLVAN